MTFKELFFQGEIPFDEIDRYTSRWNFSDETCTLAQYLGLNDVEEDVWISQSDEALEDLLESEKKHYLACTSKILFTDLDGTLLDDNKEISEQNKDAISQALKKGHAIVLTTGRALSATLPIALTLGLDQPGCYIIAFNGGQIYDCHKKRFILNKTVPFDDVFDIFDEAKKADIHCQTYEDAYFISEQDNEEVAFYKKSTGTKCRLVDDVRDELTKEPNKVLIIDLHDKDHLVAFKEQIDCSYKGRITSMFSSDYYLELVPYGVSKGYALRYLCNYLNIPHKNSIAAGDSENDLPMIKEAMIGAVMKNGLDMVKAHADYITENDHNHSGLSEIIHKFML